MRHVVLLAGMLLVLVLRARGRRILAVALALAGLGMIATGVLQAARQALETNGQPPLRSASGDK